MRLSSARIIERKNTALTMVYLAYSSWAEWQWPREFCLLQFCQREANGCIIIAQHSLDSPLCPSDQQYAGFSGHVRGWINGGGYILHPITETTSRVTYVAQLNLNGILSYLPGSWIASSQLLHLESISALTAVLEQDTISIPSMGRVDVLQQQGEEAVHPVASHPALSQEEDDDDDTLSLVECVDQRMVGVPPQYAKAGREAALKLIGLAEEESGWTILKVQDGVTVSKKDLGYSINCCKGHGFVAAPISALLALFKDLPRRTEWDALFKEGTIVHQFNEDCVINRQAFKAVFPTTARDFCTYTMSVDLGDRVAIVSTSVECPECPEVKGYVRGEILVGGFLLTPQPQGTHLIFLTQVDLKGNLPTSVVNVATQKQPLCIDGIRQVLQKQDMVPYWNIQDKIAQDRQAALVRKQQERDQKKQQRMAARTGSGLSQTDSEKEDNESDLISPLPAQEDALLEEPDDRLVISDTESNTSRRNSVTSEDGVMEDYTTMIKPAISNLAELVRGGKNEGWRSMGQKTGVVIFRKEPTPGSALYCFKGLGEIKASASAICNVCFSLKDANDWDPLFKEAQVVDTLGEWTKIINIRYQARNCLVKTARDFCLLYHCEKTTFGGYMIVAKSVVHPGCPKQKGYIRGRVLASGFYIQPKKDEPDTCLVSYISQVDLGELPSVVINLVAEKQPLVIAGLRKVLTGKA
eukprot:TRINITY_DN7819_c0_g1_i6.p1 TRINITY_DN7819_c0_g1~~TRINITY_DN7819_c0_g1_i6.p1  ORF type:complete len:696 (-),score=120.46 TRINITY_DN7819_c0_g1_i6:1265-3352(-)